MDDYNSDDSSLVEVTRQDFDTRLKSADTQPFIAADNFLQDMGKNIGWRRPRRPRVDPSPQKEHDTRDGTNQEANLNKEPSDRDIESSLDSGQGWFKGRFENRRYPVSFPTPRLMLIRVHNTDKLRRVSRDDRTRILEKIDPGCIPPATRQLKDIAEYVVAYQTELPTFDEEKYIGEAAAPKQDAAFNEDAIHVHPDVLASQMEELELSAELPNVAFNGGIFLSTGRFGFIDGFRGALEIPDNESGHIWRVDDNEQKRVYDYLRPTEVWSRSEHRLLVADYLATHPGELARALPEMKETKQHLACAIELPRTSIRKPSKAQIASGPSRWEQPESTSQNDAISASCGDLNDASLDGVKCDPTQDTCPRNTHPTLSADDNHHGPPPGFSGNPVPARSRRRNRAWRTKGPMAVSKPQDDIEATRATKKASDSRVEIQRTHLSMENRAALPAGKKGEVLRGSVKQKRRRMRSMTNEQPMVILRAYKEANETDKKATSTDFAAVTRMACEDGSADPATVKRRRLESLGTAKRKADREQSPPRKKARVQEQLFRAPSPKRMSLADLASYLARERAERARAAALKSGEKGSLLSHRPGETAAVPLTPGQGTIVLKYQQATAELAALSVARSREMSRSLTSLPSKSEGIIREKKLSTPLPIQDVNLPTSALRRTMLPPPSPIQTMSIISDRPQATTFPLSSPLPSVDFTPISSHLMMRQIPSSAGSAVFASGWCPAMIDRTPSPITLSRSLSGGPLPILSLSQDRTIDNLTRDIRRHANEVREWMNNGGVWKTPIELGLDHMVMLRDHEMLALMMALEFEKVDEVNARLMKMSDELHDSTVVLYERTKMFLGET